MYLVRVEARSKGLLSVHSQHHTFKSIEAAIAFARSIEKRNPECKCRIFRELNEKENEK